MKISAKGEYALKALLDLAFQYGKGLIPIQKIASRQKIPQRYLEQVLLQLKRSGFLQSRRGSTGGYALNRPPGEITVGEVLRAMEGKLTAFELGGRGPRGEAVDLAELWHEISEAVSAVIDRTTFADLCRRAEDRQAVARPMYHI